MKVVDRSKDFENWDTMTPSQDKYPSAPSHSYQCGSSWFFSDGLKGLGRLHKLDMENKVWSKVADFDMEQFAAIGKGSHAIVSGGDGRAYWFGGSEGMFGIYANIYNSSVQGVLEFDPSKDNEWHSLEPIDGADALRGKCGGDHPGLEYCASMERLGESEISGMEGFVDLADDDSDASNEGGGPCLMVFGGFGEADNKYFNTLYRFDIRSKSWLKLNSVVKPIGRVNPTLVHLASQQKLLMYGGRGACGAIIDDMWFFDLSKQRKGWQRVTATGTAPNDMNTTVVVIKGSQPKIMVLRESDSTKEILFYILDCLTLHWNVFNSRIQMEVNFASIFQPKESVVVDGIHFFFFLYLATSQAEERIYSVSLNNEMSLKLYHTSLHKHFCDVAIICNTNEE